MEARRSDSPGSSRLAASELSLGEERPEKRNISDDPDLINIDTYTEAKISERNLKLNGAFCHLLHFVTEPLEALLELVPQLPLGLLGGQVIPVVHVLVLPKVRCDLANLEINSKRSNVHADNLWSTSV